jgi:AcrR family transcriptional regulator
MTSPAPLRQPSRDKILDCAEQLFARRGFAGIGLAEVAEQVGLSKSSLFHHFSSKAQLYAAVMARILDRIEAELMRSLVAGGGPVQRLERWLDVVIDVLATHPTYARLLLRSLFEDDELAGELPEEQAVNATLRRIVGAAEHLLREGIEMRVFRPVHVAHMVQSVIGLTVFHFASGEFGEEIIGRPLFTASEVRRRKLEVKNLIRHGLVLSPNQHISRVRSS